MPSQRLTNLAPAPRRVPLLGVLNIFFGGPFSFFGWFFFGFSTIFLWAFLPDLSLDFITFIGQKAQTEGTVIEVFKTNFSEGGSDNTPGASVYGYKFEFVDSSGGLQKGVSYAPGERYKNGDHPRVEYLIQNTKKARITGLRTGMVGPSVLFILLFPVVGIAFIIKGIRDGFLALPLLKNGVQASGTLLSKEPTNTRINNMPVYKLTFQFKVNGMVYNSIVKTHQPFSVEDEQEEPILYNPEDPNKSVLLDSLPGKIDVREDGELISRKGFSAIAVTIAPGITIIGNLLYIYFRFFR